MNRSRNRWAVLLLVVGTSLTSAQEGGPEDERDPKRRHWQWVQDVRLPDKAPSPYLSLAVPPAVFDKAQPDLRDLRLTDSKGIAVPYALRIMRAEPKQTDIRRVRPTFNAGPGAKDGEEYYQFSVELDAIPILKKQAREAGCDGIIEIEAGKPTSVGIETRTLHVSATGIVYKDSP